MATPLEVLKILTWASTFYPNFKLPKATIDNYAQMFADEDAEVLSAAMMQAVKGSEFFPGPSRITDQIMVIKDKISPLPDYAQAWDDIHHIIQKYGYEEALRRDLHVFAHPIIEAAVRRFGWDELCHGDSDNNTTRRAQFRDIFNTIRDREIEDARMIPEMRAIIKKLAEKLNMGKRLLNGGDHAA